MNNLSRPDFLVYDYASQAKIERESSNYRQFVGRQNCEKRNLFTEEDIECLNIEEKRYEKLIEKNMNLIPKNTKIISYIGDDLIKIYKNRFTKTEYYKILVREKTKWCPYCGFERVKELDHFLPKEVYPTLSIVPLNLVPICGTCNQKKDKKGPSKNDEYIFHPYIHQISFENISVECIVDKEIITFIAKKVLYGANELTNNLVKYSYEKLNLRKRISDSAIDKFSNLKKPLITMAKRGKKALKDYIRVTMRSEDPMLVEMLKALLFNIDDVYKCLKRMSANV